MGKHSKTFQDTQQGFGQGMDFDFEDLFNNFTGFGGFGFGDMGDIFQEEEQDERIKI